MEFKPAKCPNCGGELQLPENLARAKCMYCGGEIIVVDAIKKYSSEVNLDNIFTLAKAAKESGNNEEAYKYYTKILEFNPNSYDAWFGKALTAGWQSTLANIRLQEVIQGINKSIELAPADKIDQLKIEAAIELNSLANAIYNLAYENFTTYISLDTYNEFITRMWLIIDVYKIASEYKPDDITILENIINTVQTYMKRYKNEITDQTVYLNKEGVENAKQIIFETEEKIRKIKPDYKADIPSNSACYIATAVYGDYNCHEVKILRKFRDNYLSRRKWGKFFIKYYYIISPSLAKRMGNRRFINYPVKKILDKIVIKLSKEFMS